MTFLEQDRDGLRLGKEGRKFFLSRYALGLLLLCAAPWLMAQGRHGEAGKRLPDAPVPGESGQAESPPCGAGVCSAHAGLCCGRSKNRFKVYLQSQAYHVDTPRQLAMRAVKDVADPFNLLSVLGSAAIVVGSDSHSIYGPGMAGLARATGVTLTENMTDEFFGTFLIPSLDHQEPGFRRMPNRPFWDRLAHCATQVLWTRSQTGRPMFNYSTVVGNVAEEGVAVTYVPFRQTGWGPSAERVALNYATDPIGNLINEFVPQVASHINVKVVFFQNIVNRVATTVGQPAGM